jgi:hypothetical protein
MKYLVNSLSKEELVNTKQKIQFALFVTLLLAAGMACNLFSGLTKASEGINTAEAMITDAGPGIETAQALITDVGAKITESGIIETVQAVATDIPLPTLEGEPPADIPIMEGKRSAEVMSSNLISYVIDAAFDDVVNFYDREMVAQGWVKNESESKKTANLIQQLVFEKDGRKATITIAEVPFVNQINVTIEIK